MLKSQAMIGKGIVRTKLINWIMKSDINTLKWQMDEEHIKYDLDCHYKILDAVHVKCA